MTRFAWTKIIGPALMALASIVSTTKVFAWGATGHQAIAIVANSRLSDAEKAKFER
jgi:hypothetical protein